MFGAPHTMTGPLTETEQSETERMFAVAGDIWSRFLHGEPPADGAEAYDPDRKPTLFIGLHPHTKVHPRGLSGLCLAGWMG